MLGTWIVPKVEINLSGYYSFLSGRTYTPFQRFGTRAPSTSPLGGTPAVPRAAREPAPRSESYLDLRVEKVFNISDAGRLAVFTDIQNLFNASTVDAVNARYPNISVAGYDDPIAFEGPTNIVQPRRFSWEPAGASSQPAGLRAAATGRELKAIVRRPRGP